jgi:biofilm PGA synthesis N-glycosyltransferase PgaC
MRFLFFGSAGLIAYTFLGYPALVATLARLRPRPIASDPGFEPRVSLLIAAYNEADIIEARLENIRQLDYPSDRLEVIVVADGCEDDTAERVARFGGTKVLYRPERGGKLEAVKRGAAEASGEILVVTDANNRYTPETLRRLVAPFADPAVGVVTGRKAIDDGSERPLDRAEGLYWRYEDRLKKWEAVTGSVTGVAGEILAFRKSAFYPPRAGTMNEDFVFAMLAAINGWRVAYAHEALSLERASATLSDEATRRTRLVTGRWQAMRDLLPAMVRRRPLLAWQVLSHKGLRPLVPWAMLAAAVSNAVLARDQGWARQLLAAQATFYLAALAGLVEERRGRRNRLLYLPYYFCHMNAATIAGLRDFALGRREAVWAKVRRG